MALTFDLWRDRAEQLLKESYLMDFHDAGLSDSELERHAVDFSPQEFVDWFAEKYGLVSAASVGLKRVAHDHH